MCIPSPVASEGQGWSAIAVALEARTDHESGHTNRERETLEEVWLPAEPGAGRN